MKTLLPVALQESLVDDLVAQAWAFYEKHRDRFRDDRRERSALFYLNEDWSAATGGALRLHLDEQRSIDVQPVAGRLLLFRPAPLRREVLPARRERLLLTGWSRRRGEGVIEYAEGPGQPLSARSGGAL